MIHYLEKQILFKLVITVIQSNKRQLKENQNYLPKHKVSFFQHSLFPKNKHETAIKDEYTSCPLRQALNLLSLFRNLKTLKPFYRL